MPQTPSTSGEGTSALALKGRTIPWGPAGVAALAICALVALWLRLDRLSAEGFADDELHKWLAANRYLIGDFGGDDLEHPMLMKSLIALALIAGRTFGWVPETITRLPNALAGAVAVVVLGLLGRRLFGRVAGLFAAALGAVSVSWIGYQRIAKEDVVLGLFVLVLCLCIADAKAAADGGEPQRVRRFEFVGALSFAAMLATKYYPYLPLLPIAMVLSISSGDTTYRVSLRRWVELGLVSLLFFLCLNWIIVRPSTWSYFIAYIGGSTQGGRATHLTMLFMGRFYETAFPGGVRRLPFWFYLVFAVVKQTPGTLLLSLAGLIWAVFKRRPSQRLILAWLAVWFVSQAVISGAKYGRMFVPIFSVFFLLAGAAASWLIEWAQRPKRSALAAGGIAVALAGASIVPELAASLSHAPHFRTYISPLGGGERLVSWYFPHCDYFDAGFREAIDYVAQHAEPAAEIASEIDWTAGYYAERAGRNDLLFTMLRPNDACQRRRVCYVAVQVGRRYEVNRSAVEALSKRRPWHTVSIRGVDAVKVYRLEPGEFPFPNGARSSVAD